MTPIDRGHLITNIVAHASDRVSAEVQPRVSGRRERVRYGAP
jgi:hypothetical protein